MEWPSNSPDLNPIENCFGWLKAIIYAGAKQYNIICKKIGSNKYQKDLLNQWTLAWLSCLKRKAIF